MATQALLAELAAAWHARGGGTLAWQSVGGVDAARRVQAGEPFDLVVLAAEAIDALEEAGRVRQGSRVDLARSSVAVAVRAGAPAPDVSSAEGVRAAVLAARRIGISTGPSGVQLGRLFERWGLGDMLRERLVTAPPGLPVGALLARGEVDLGFQQRSELMHLAGIQVLGPLPAQIAIVTTFAAAICCASTQPQSAAEVLRFLASAEAAPAKRRHGMEAPA